jgi:hypothetical protein
MIKIARFIVLHTAVRLDPNSSEIVQYLRGRTARGDWFSNSPLDDDDYIFMPPESRPASPNASSSPPLPSSDSGLVNFS